jgi:hypothetical protein
MTNRTVRLRHATEGESVETFDVRVEDGWRMLHL